MKGGGGAAATASAAGAKVFWRVPFEDPLWNFKRGDYQRALFVL